MAPEKPTNSQQEIIRQTEAVVDSALSGKFANKGQFEGMINELAAKAKLESPALAKKIELVRDDILSKYEMLNGQEFAEKRQVKLRTKEKILRILEPNRVGQTDISREVKGEILVERYYELQKTINSMKWSFMYRAKYPSKQIENLVSQCYKKFTEIENLMPEARLFNDQIHLKMDELDNLLDGRDPKSGQKTSSGFELAKFIQSTSQELEIAEKARDEALNPLANSVIDALDQKNATAFDKNLKTLVAKFKTFQVLNDVNYQSVLWTQLPTHKGMMLMLSSKDRKNPEITLLNMSDFNIVSVHQNEKPTPFQKLSSVMHPQPNQKNPDQLAAK